MLEIGLFPGPSRRRERSGNCGDRPSGIGRCVLIGDTPRVFGQVVSDCEPRRFVDDKRVRVGANVGIFVERRQRDTIERHGAGGTPADTDQPCYLYNVQGLTLDNVTIGGTVYNTTLSA